MVASTLVCANSIVVSNMRWISKILSHISQRSQQSTSFTILLDCYNVKYTNSVALAELCYNLYCGTMFYHHLPGFVFICRWTAVYRSSRIPCTWYLITLAIWIPTAVFWLYVLSNLIIFKNLVNSVVNN